MKVDRKKVDWAEVGLLMEAIGAVYICISREGGGWAVAIETDDEDSFVAVSHEDIEVAAEAAVAKSTNGRATS